MAARKTNVGRGGRAAKAESAAPAAAAEAAPKPAAEPTPEPDARDQQIAALESRIADLEGQVKTLARPANTGDGVGVRPDPAEYRASKIAQCRRNIEQAEKHNNKGEAARWREKLAQLTR